MTGHLLLCSSSSSSFRITLSLFRMMLSSDSTSVLSGKSIGKLHLNTSHSDNGPLSIRLKRICSMKFPLIFKHFENGCSETSLCTPPSICENPHVKYYLLIIDSITAIPLFNSLFSIHVSLISSDGSYKEVPRLCFHMYTVLKVLQCEWHLSGSESFSMAAILIPYQSTFGNFFPTQCCFVGSYMRVYKLYDFL